MAWYGAHLSTMFVLWRGLTVRKGARPSLPGLRSLELSLGTEKLPAETREAQRDWLTVMICSRKTACVVEGREVVALEVIKVDETLDL